MQHLVTGLKHFRSDIDQGKGVKVGLLYERLYHRQFQIWRYICFSWSKKRCFLLHIKLDQIFTNKLNMWKWLAIIRRSRDLTFPSASNEQTSIMANRHCSCRRMATDTGSILMPLWCPKFLLLLFLASYTANNQFKFQNKSSVILSVIGSCVGAYSFKFCRRFCCWNR